MKLKMRALFLCLTSSGLFACRQGTDLEGSQLHLQNAIEIGSHEFPSVVLLMRVDGLSRRYCTASFINEHQAVTAAHCVGSPDKSELYLMQPTPGDDSKYQIASKALSVHIHPDYREGPIGQHAHDLALVNFPAGSVSDSMELSSQPAHKNSEVTLVGYGSTDVKPGLHEASLPDKKRYGKNTIQSTDGGLLTIFGAPQSIATQKPGRYVSSAAGDSGSPWIAEGKLLSMTIGAQLRQQSQGSWLTVTYAVDLTHSSNQDFLSDWMD